MKPTILKKVNGKIIKIELMEQIKPNYKKGFEILEEYFDYIPDMDKSIVHEKLLSVGL